MKYKHILILAVIFAFLFTLTVVKKTFLKPQTFETEYKSLQIQINPADVYTIEIYKSGAKSDSLEFKKDNQGEWQIAFYKNKQVDKEKIESFIKEISNLKGELRSSDAELLADYGISDEEAIVIKVLNENADIQERFLVGIKNPGYGNSFIRKPASREVYIVNKDIFQLLGLYGNPKEADLINTNLVSDKPLPEETV